MSIQSVNALNDTGFANAYGTTKPALPQDKLPEIEFNSINKLGPEELQNAIDDANKMLAYVRPDIKFVIDEATKDVVIMLVEPSTGDVINRYPTEQALAISNAIVESQARAAERQTAFDDASKHSLGLFVKHRI